MKDPDCANGAASKKTSRPSSPRPTTPLLDFGAEAEAPGLIYEGLLHVSRLCDFACACKKA